MSGTGAESCAATVPILDPAALGRADWATADLIVHGSARAALDAMPAGSAHVAVTSPPYFGQRD